MANNTYEHLPYRGESPADRLAYTRYLDEIQRGKSLLQLLSVRDAVTPEISRSWSPRSFTPVQTSEGVFDAVVCNISYRFQKHGEEYSSVAHMTAEAQKYFKLSRNIAVASMGTLRLPGGVFEADGRIITFY